MRAVIFFKYLFINAQTLYIVLFLLLAVGCNSSNDASKNDYSWQEIAGRDEGEPSTRFNLYRAKVPLDWQRIDPVKDDSNADSKLSICEYIIGSGDGATRLTVHNFPSMNMQARIPPTAQINRWKQQFQQLKVTDFTTQAVAKGGYIGLQLAATGIMEGQPCMVLGWSLQLAPEQYLNMQEDNFIQRQRRSDYTIKAVGSPASILANRDEIELFAHSFELIEEIPQR